MELDEINELEISLGVDVGFFQSLLTEDDWSFVIKLHALLEAATGHLLVEHFDDERLVDVIAHLEMSNQRTGKVGLLKSMELISSDHKRFIVSLSELRNSLVHEIRNVNFSFKEMVSKYSDKEFQNFMKRFGLFLSSEQLSEKMYAESAKNDPKLFIFSSSVALLTFIYLRKKTSCYQRFFKAVKLVNEEPN
ncbi:hypothetical protein CHH28_02825 [Bacterioplanes sanyensis]|uniref:DUF4145 domain-containing protein n=1 Tax=Bacterioplanes sanyensis TaxID=1249553 RepID=A0A222FGF0_9GAMM|nr:hypothetical protein [Bacterioplanes sanyensis]ASP37666.1 hypothetical protein CHH28_02825 [Bacterioplanes sanyensis]